MSSGLNLVVVTLRRFLCNLLPDNTMIVILKYRDIRKLCAQTFYATVKIMVNTIIHRCVDDFVCTQVNIIDAPMLAQCTDIILSMHRSSIGRHYGHAVPSYTTHRTLAVFTI